MFMVIGNPFTMNLVIMSSVFIRSLFYLLFTPRLVVLLFMLQGVVFFAAFGLVIQTLSFFTTLQTSTGLAMGTLKLIERLWST